MTGVTNATFEIWFDELKQAAARRELSWLIASSPESHRKGYDKGLTPDEELNSLADLAEWRGCGCGGG